MRWVREFNRERGSSHRYKEVYAPEGAEALFAEEMDSGTHVFLALSEQEDEQGLREVAGERRSLHLRGYEPPDGEEIGPLMRVFRQFHNGVLRSSPMRQRTEASHH